MLRQALVGDDGVPSLLQQENVLIMGDFNMDPWRSKDKSSKTWNTILKQGQAGKPYHYHSGIAEIEPPRYTWVYIIHRTFDIVASNFAKGTCIVLGQTPGTYRMDGGSGNDHRAVFGVLEFAP